MPEQTTGSEPGNGQTTPQGTPPTPAPRPASPAPVPPAPQPPESLTTPPPSSQLGDVSLEELQRNWNHTRGEIMTRNQQWETWQGQMQQVEANLREQNTDLQRQIEQLQGTSQQLSTQLEGMQQQVAQLPDLQQQAARAERLQTILRYPNIVAQTEVQMSEGEDGQQIEQRINPYLDLLLDSNRSGSDFEQAVAALDAKLRGQAAATPGSTTPGGMQIRPPQPPTPAGPASQIADLERQRDEAHLAGNYDAMRNLEDRILELKLQQQ